MRSLTYRSGCTEVVIMADAGLKEDALLVKLLVIGSPGSAISRKLW